MRFLRNEPLLVFVIVRRSDCQMEFNRNSYECNDNIGEHLFAIEHGILPFQDVWNRYNVNTNKGKFSISFPPSINSHPIEKKTKMPEKYI